MNLLQLLLANPEAAIALLTAITAALARLANAFHYRNKDDLTMLLDRRMKANEIINELNEEIGSARVVIFAAHNGKEDIDTKTINMLYSSVLDVSAVESEALMGFKENWRGQGIDGVYNKVVHQVRTEKITQVKASDLKNSILKRMYDAQGIVQSIVAEVKPITKYKHWKGIVSSEKKLFKYIFLSCNFTEPIQKEKEILIMEKVRVAAAKIRAIT